MLSDLDCCDLLQSQYDGVSGVFDYQETIDDGPVTYALKFYPDCSVVAFEGSHDLPDWISNFQAQMIFLRDLGGVESGFYAGLPQAYTRIVPKLQKDKQVYCIGHSRGAAHANIFAAMLIKAGFTVHAVSFGLPRPGDNDLMKILQTQSNTWYRNYRNFIDQDFICDMPFPTLDWHYAHPSIPKIIDVPAPPDDPWLILSRHHLQLYRKGIVDGQVAIQS